MQPDYSFDSVTYQGEKIMVARRYEDFRDYKDDPENLPTHERTRVAKLVRVSSISKQFSTRKDLEDAVFKLMFPGYGLSMFQLREPVALYSIEVPYADEDRLLVFTQDGERWVAVDDFVWPQAAGQIETASYLNGRLQYKDRNGKVVRER